MGHLGEYERPKGWINLKTKRKEGEKGKEAVERERKD
jgi:hypothetical protein